jgi:hypothetical protein
MDSPAAAQHIDRPHLPDTYWARMQPVTIMASQDRLDARHCLVTVKNSSDTELAHNGRVVPQLHVVIDRHMQGHELQPGQSKEVDLLVEQIEYFLQQRRPGRMNMFNGRPHPLHPIVVVGFDPDKVLDPTRPNDTPPPPSESKERRTIKAA